MKEKIYLLFLVSLFTGSIFAQVGINTTDPKRDLDIDGDMRLSETYRRYIEDTFTKTVYSYTTNPLKFTREVIPPKGYDRILIANSVSHTNTNTNAIEEKGFVDYMALDALNRRNTPPNFFIVDNVPESGQTLDFKRLGNLNMRIRRDTQPGKNPKMFLEVQLANDADLGGFSRDVLALRVVSMEKPTAEGTIGTINRVVNNVNNISLLKGQWVNLSGDYEVTNSSSPSSMDHFKDVMNIDDASVKAYFILNRSKQFFVLHIKVMSRYDIADEIYKNVENNPRRVMVYVEMPIDRYGK